MSLRDAGLCRTADGCWYSMWRRKSPRVVPDDGRDGVKFTSIIDLTTLGLSVMLGMSIYILTGQSIKDIAGPSLLLSAIVAATAAGLSGKALILYRVPSGILHNY